MNTIAFTDLGKEMKRFDERRERIITASRDIRKLSKAAIYALHRGTVAQCESLLKQAQKHKKKVDLLIKKYPELRTIGAYNEGAEEFVEAHLFLSYVKKKPFSTAKKLVVSPELYLRGLCDLTGELSRKAVNDVINGNEATAREIKNSIEHIYSQLLQFDFRNSSLRQKFDRVKYTIERLDDVVLKITLRT